jgi:hypothetical protein
MAKSKETVAPISMPTEPVTVFEVSEDGGTLRVADYPEPETRAEFYEDMAVHADADLNQPSRSPDRARYTDADRPLGELACWR